MFNQKNIFTVNPSILGLPSREELIDMRIWDLHYHGTRNHEEVVKYVLRMGIERVISLDIGTWGESTEDRERDEQHQALLNEWQDLMLGITRINPSRPADSIERMNRWIENGPAIGIKYGGGHNPEGTTCSHPNNDPIIERAKELNAVIYVHTWIKVGGEPRYAGGGNNYGESTPIDVAKLAKRFPEVPIICGHQGGDWELGIRAIRPYENVFMEFSGGKPASGAVDFAVKELGAERLVWGGHLPSRSYANELSKVYDADLTDMQRRKVFGENLRKIAYPILKDKGYSIEI